MRYTKQVMKKLALTIFAVFGIFLFSAQHHAMAQTTHLTPFFININPLYPQPYSSVQLSLSSNSISVTNSTFSVSVNGKKVGVGTGAQQISFETGAPGKSMVVVVSATFHGKVYKKTLTLHPASVALVVEPLATAPVWYQGIPTIPSFGKVRLVAIPNMQANGKQIDPSKLSYSWKIGDQMLPTSGVGKDSAIIDAPLPYRNILVSVVVHNLQNTQTAQQALTMVSNTPIVHIYADNPLTGIDYNHALSSSAQIGSVESTFVAVPYGFPLGGDTPSTTWSLNDVTVQTGPLLTVRPQGSGTGSATMSATVQKEPEDVQESAQLSIQFGSHASGFGLFGL